MSKRSWKLVAKNESFGKTHVQLKLAGIGAANAEFP